MWGGLESRGLESLKRAPRKIRFPLSADDWPNLEAELIEAEPVGNDRYRVLRAPFYAYGLSRNDVVAARIEGEGPVFARAVQRAGHSTYRIYRLDADDRGSFEKLIAELENLGCVIRVAKRNLLSVDVPPATNIHATYAVLQDGETSGVWEFEEGHCGHSVERPN